MFGSAGHFMFFVVQAATALILYTGGNTSFNGFPFLTSFVAEDSFLPRWLMKRGQRLVFSNGIIVLTVLSVTLIGVVGANVNALVPFYAIGVFTAFSMAGFGMARYYHPAPGTRLAAQAGHLLLVRGAHLDRGGDLRRGEVHRGRLADPDHLPDRGLRADQAQPAVPREAGALQTIGDRRASGRGTEPAELQPPGGHRLRGRLRPVHHRGAALRQGPAAHHAARRALRHRHRAGREAPAGLAAGQERVAGVRRRPGPQADPRRRRTGLRRRRPRPAPR